MTESRQMSSEGRRSNETQVAPVYTVYPVPCGDAGNFNYGFYQNNPYAPPPKYEEVVGGIPGAPVPPLQPHGTYNTQEQPGVIFVAPTYKPSRLQRCLAVIFSVLFIIGFTSILLKILNVSLRM